MKYEIGDYIITFNPMQHLLLKLCFVIFILIIFIIILKFILSSETKGKIKNWIGKGFWCGIGFFFSNFFITIMLFLILFLIFLV